MRFKNALSIVALSILTIAAFQNCGKSFESASPNGSAATQFIQNANRDQAILSAEQDARNLASIGELLPLQVSCLFNGAQVENGNSVTAYQNGNVPAGQSCVSELRTCNQHSLSGSYRFSQCTVSTKKSCVFNSVTLKSGEKVNGYKEVYTSGVKSCEKKQLTCSDGNLDGSDEYPLAKCSTDIAKKSCVFDGVQIQHGEQVVGYQISNPMALTVVNLCSQLTMVCNDGQLAGAKAFPYSSCPNSGTTQSRQPAGTQPVGVAPTISTGGNSCSFKNISHANGETFYGYITSVVGNTSSCSDYAVELVCTNGTVAQASAPSASILAILGRCDQNGVCTPATSIDINKKLVGTCHVNTTTSCSLLKEDDGHELLITFKNGAKKMGYTTQSLSVGRNPNDCNTMYGKMLTCTDGWFGPDSIRYKYANCTAQTESSRDHDQAYWDAQHQTPEPAPTPVAQPPAGQPKPGTPAPGGGTTPPGGKPGVYTDSNGNIIDHGQNLGQPYTGPGMSPAPQGAPPSGGQINNPGETWQTPDNSNPMAPPPGY